MLSENPLEYFHTFKLLKKDLNLKILFTFFSFSIVITSQKVDQKMIHQIIFKPFLISNNSRRLRKFIHKILS